MAVAAGIGGEKTITVPSHWLAYPGSINPEIMGGHAGGRRRSPAPTATASSDSPSNSSEPPAFRVGGTRRRSQSPDVTATMGDTELVVDVTNDTDLEYWAWGVVATGRAQVAPEALTVGGSGRAEVVPGQSGFNEFGSLGDAVIQARQLWNDPFIWSKLNLGFTADAMLDGINTYFFGFTDQLTIPIELDGRAVEVAGHDVDQSFRSSPRSDRWQIDDQPSLEHRGRELGRLRSRIPVAFDRRDDGRLESCRQRPRATPASRSTTCSARSRDGSMPTTGRRRAMTRSWSVTPSTSISIAIRLVTSWCGPGPSRRTTTPQFFELPMSPYAFTLEWDR